MYKVFLYDSRFRLINWTKFVELTLDLINDNGTRFVDEESPVEHHFIAEDNSNAVLCTDATPANFSLETWSARFKKLTQGHWSAHVKKGAAAVTDRGDRS